MTPLFLDSGFLIALEARDDQHHAASSAFWRAFETNPSPLVTTSFILDEVATFFNRHGHHAKAVEIGRYLLHSPSVLFQHVDDSLFQEGWRLFQRYDDKRFSLTDCVSFALMKRLRLKTALGFDRHFTQAGFTIKP